MVVTSAKVSGSVSSTSSAASTLPSCTTHLDWGFKKFTLLLSVRKFSWGIFYMQFNFLVQRVLIVCCNGGLLSRLSFGALEILIGFNISSLLGFTIIFVRFPTWGSGRYPSYLTNLGLAGSCLECLLIGSNRSGCIDGGLESFRWHSYGLSVYNVEI